VARAPPDNSPRPSALNYRLAFFARLIDASRARRAAVRLRAAASEAFFARAERSSAVIFFAAFLPPSLPYCCPKPLRYSSTSGGIRLTML
jgi:hypothetical protein